MKTNKNGCDELLTEELEKIAAYFARNNILDGDVYDAWVKIVAHVRASTKPVKFKVGDVVKIKDGVESRRFDESHKFEKSFVGPIVEMDGEHIRLSPNGGWFEPRHLELVLDSDRYYWAHIMAKRIREKIDESKKDTPFIGQPAQPAMLPGSIVDCFADIDKILDEYGLTLKTCRLCHKSFEHGIYHPAQETCPHCHWPIGHDADGEKKESFVQNDGQPCCWITGPPHGKPDPSNWREDGCFDCTFFKICGKLYENAESRQLSRWKLGMPIRKKECSYNHTVPSGVAIEIPMPAPSAFRDVECCGCTFYKICGRQCTPGATFGKEYMKKIDALRQKEEELRQKEVDEDGLAAKIRGKHVCPHCGCMKTDVEGVLVCEHCERDEWHGDEPEPIREMSDYACNASCGRPFPCHTIMPDNYAESVACLCFPNRRIDKPVWHKISKHLDSGREDSGEHGIFHPKVIV